MDELVHEACVLLVEPFHPQGKVLAVAVASQQNEDPVCSLCGVGNLVSGSAWYSHPAIPLIQ
jgi:hypothetical protein